MPKIKVEFEYRTGVRHGDFRNVRLMGCWTPEGLPGDEWTAIPMKPFRSEDGCPSFRAWAELDSGQVGQTYCWGVMLDTPGRSNVWAVTTENGDFKSGNPGRSFVLTAEGGVECYWLTHCHRLGANKAFKGKEEQARLVFSVWAPHARKVETVIAADDSGGYIFDDGRGEGMTLPMTVNGEGIWSTDTDDPKAADFSAWLYKPYLFKITREDGSVAYRTDLYSRHQAGTGGRNPAEGDWSGRPEDLDAIKSCSVVLDPALVADDPGGPELAAHRWLEENDFWAREFHPLRPLPSRVEGLVIYEMHVGGLGCRHGGPGTLRDAVDMLDYLMDLGINAIELMPMNEFGGEAGWGYGTSHYFAIKYDRGGRDQLKHFVRACHRRGIAVIMDVVYNHYTPDGERAEWMYDSVRHDHNMYYYYQGVQEDYPEDFPEGGYCDNQSTGYLPNLAEVMVRKMLISSAVAMVMEFHIDGFRVDLTQALHSFNVLHLDGRPAPEANESGIRFMREWVRTLRLFKPSIVLIAEDHSDWKDMTRSQMSGGIGFDSVWWAEWHHQLIGKAESDPSKARLLYLAGRDDDKPLDMELFGKIIMGTPGKVVYQSSHDEVGNSRNSARTIETAVGGMLFDNTRFWAEARCRTAAALTVLSAGTPMFFMGEEVGAREPYRYGDFLEHREDYEGMRLAEGAGLFRFFQDLIRLRLWSSAFLSPGVEVIFTHNQDRILAFRRWWGEEEFLVIASLSTQAFDGGYPISHKSLTGKNWLETLNSDASIYGGAGVVNPGRLAGPKGELSPRLPASGVSVLVNAG